jgi:hypothetical protein
MNNSITTASNIGAFDAIRHIDENQQEYWFGKELMPLLGYRKWQRFEDVIDRAMISCEVAGVSKSLHFEFLPEAVKTSAVGGRPGEDYKLSRYASYLTAMNGDVRKPEIASAQAYFATKAREAELATAEPKPKRRSIYDLHGTELALIACYQAEIEQNPDGKYSDIIVQEIEREFWSLPEKVALYLAQQKDREDLIATFKSKFQLDWFTEIDTAKTPELLLAKSSIFIDNKKDWLFDPTDLRAAGKIIAKQELDRGLQAADEKYPRNPKLEAAATKFQENLDLVFVPHTKKSLGKGFGKSKK